MKICLVGFHNLPLLAREYRRHHIGGEAVQKTLLARALARRGHDVSMGEDKVLAAYLHTFQRVLRMGSSGAKIIVTENARNV
jgi:hypothetical protein